MNITFYINWYLVTTGVWKIRFIYNYQLTKLLGLPSRHLGNNPSQILNSLLEAYKVNHYRLSLGESQMNLFTFRANSYYKAWATYMAKMFPAKCVFKVLKLCPIYGVWITWDWIDYRYLVYFSTRNRSWLPWQY